MSPEAESWLQRRASTLGMGGIGKALGLLYFAYKIVFANGADTITVEHLEDALTIGAGPEDAAVVAEIVAQSSGIRRVV